MSTSTPENTGRFRATVIDAGVGNLGNLVRALEHLGAEATLTTDPEVVAESRCLVLPGVGAFRPPRESLRGSMEAALRSALDDGAYLLGICVGYQLLFEASTEFGETDAALFGGAIKISGIAGDQQAATVGQACFQPGMLKSTYGTGCFALLNTGADAVGALRGKPRCQVNDFGALEVPQPFDAEIRTDGGAVLALDGG